MGGPDVSLGEMAYTLQTGREAMDSRVAFVVKDIASLRDKLTSYLTGEAAVKWGYRGEAQREEGRRNPLKNDDDAKQLISLWLSKGKLKKLTE